MNDDFYVGYLPKAPDVVGKRVTRIAIGLVTTVCAVAAALIFDQAPYAASKFEYGVYRQYSGVMEAWPYPILRTHDGSFLLVGNGKHGFSDPLNGLQGKSVRFDGSLIERGRDRMLEVRPGSLQLVAAIRQSTVERVSLGLVKLQGEIVDGKCYLGVMNPGDGKVHRDCAVRCISGGAPPAFVARDASGETRVLLLTGSDGRQMNAEVLSFVAEPIEITGQIVRFGSNLILSAEPAQFRRVSE